jgi:hypothetical protein
MSKIFIAPQSGEQTTTKFFKTENGGYKVSELEQFVTNEDYIVLKSFPEIFFWGNKPNSKSKWDKIEIGDYILFYKKRTIISYSKIIYKTQNPKLAEEIWGWTKTEKGEDVLWEFLYFYEKPVTVEIPFMHLIKFAGYSENYVIQGFTPYSEIGTEKINIKYGDIEFFLSSFNKNNFSFEPNIDFKISGLILDDRLVFRYFSSLLTKPFVILTGLSGSGKTKLAQAFAMWMSSSKEQYSIIPVGADWTNREPLLGYPNSLNNNHYVKPDSGVLDIVLAAYNDYNSNNQELAKCQPYFLILDEMNLSHVERYFADFLSTMESGDVIKLYSGGNRSSSVSATGEYLTASHVPDKIRLPKNLFIIGTVNIDETTYMFSPKVLDRANTIEFRISESEMITFFETNGTLNMNLLLEDSQTNKGKGAQFNAEFMRLAAGEKIDTNKTLHQVTFLSFFDKLQEAGAEFGYRTANEMTQLMAYLDFFGVHGNAAYDIAIMQKLLPKLHGSRSKLSKVLPALLNLCMDSSQEIIFPLSFEKLSRMQKNAQENGFASYAEA